MTSLHGLTTILAVLAPQSQDIRSYVQSAFDDAQFTVVTGAHSIPELSKINKDFTQSYRFKSSQVWLKEPFKLKMISEVDDSQIMYIVNGGKRMYKIPRSGLSQISDVSKAPGRRQTSFDFGILTPSLFNNFFQATFVRSDRATGDVVFDLTYVPALADTSRQRIWIDPATKQLTKREWYAQRRNQGRLMATFFYENPKKFGDITMATQVIVNNADNKRAGVVNYTGIKINTGLADSIFALK